MRYVEHFKAAFTIAKTQVEELYYDFRKGRLNRKLFKLFNVMLIYGDECPVEFSNAIECDIDANQNLYNFTFELLKVDKTTNLMEADSFQIAKYTRTTN